VAVQTFSLLADRSRLGIVWHLRDGERTVNELAERVGKAPATISQHLAKLRLAGIVASRRDGTFIHYHLADIHVRELVEDALSHADHLESGIQDPPA
jgi:DNA-binding transcriptional ArsR family regulator